MNRFNQRKRTIQRLLASALDSRLYPSALPMRTFWWTGHPNFGDDLTRVLLPSWNIAPILKPARNAQFFGVGSIIELIPDDFSGWIWGSGKMHQDVPTSLPHARVLAVRGALTRDLMGLDDTTPLGDPGLLVSHVFKRAPMVPKRIAVVPHFSHQQLPDVRRLIGRLGRDAIYVDVTKPVKTVVRRISSAQYVLTTSLHGLITADAYGIPAAWALPAPTLAGGEFKFHDHESVVRPGSGARKFALSEVSSRSDALALAKPADELAVARAQDDLSKVLAEFLAPPERKVSPLLLAFDQWRE